MRQPFTHVCIAVHDIDKAVDTWTRILGVLDPQQLEEPLVHYDDWEGADDRMRFATFVSPGGCAIQLMQPAPDTPIGRRLEAIGEHVHHLCFFADDPGAAASSLEAEGIRTSGSVNVDPKVPWLRWTWALPRSTHGALIEIATPYDCVDGAWVEPSGSD